MPKLTKTDVMTGTHTKKEPWRKTKKVLNWLFYGLIGVLAGVGLCSVWQSFYIEEPIHTVEIAQEKPAAINVGYIVDYQRAEVVKCKILAYNIYFPKYGTGYVSSGEVYPDSILAHKALCEALYKAKEDVKKEANQRLQKIDNKLDSLCK